MTAHVELTAEQVYAEATDFFGRLASSPSCGFKVLYGPPLYRPPIFFVGYQPGGKRPKRTATAGHQRASTPPRIGRSP